MKYILWVLFCGLIVGCKTGLVEPDPTPPPVVTKYTISASVIGGGGTVSPAETVVVKGGSVDFVITPQNGYKAYSITVNGVKTPLASTIYSILNISSNYKIEVIFMSDIPTAKDTLMTAFWTDGKQFMSLDKGLNWSEEVVDAAYSNAHYYFLERDILKVFFPPYISFSPSTWKISGRNLILADQTYYFILTNNQLTLFIEKVGVDLQTGKTFPVLHKKVLTR